MKHFKDHQQERERHVTATFARDGVLHSQLAEAIGIEGSYWLTTEFDKSKYGCKGDVDIAFVENPGGPQEAIYAVEVKVIYLDPLGQFKSEKKEKHHKQIKLLETEGWNKVFLLDVIVTAPAETWFHPQAFEGFDKYRKAMRSKNAGHIVMQVNSVAHIPETSAGSVSTKVLQHACFMQSTSPTYHVIKNALRNEMEARRSE